jgi:ABC-type phosphate/phosphonate transport system substrate-binding protein
MKMVYHWLVLVVLTLLAASSPVASAAVAKKQMVLAVSEGTSGGITAEAAQAKYQALADALGTAINAEFKVQFVREFALLTKGMQENQFDLVLARPSDYPARGMRDNKYQFVASASPDGHCMLIVHKDSPIKSIADLKGTHRTFVMPEENAYMTRFCRAELRDSGILLENERVHYVREQAVIPFAIENRISNVGGVASYSGAYAKWAKGENRVLYKSRAQPYLPMVASPNLSPEQVAKLKGALVELGNSDAGKQVLKRVGVAAFVTTEEGRLRKLLDWLKV